MNTLFSKMQQEELELNVVIDLEGTIRKMPVLQTKAMITPLLKNFGITRVADIDGLDTLGIPVSVAIRPNARHLCDALGKGLTKAFLSARLFCLEK